MTEAEQLTLEHPRVLSTYCIVVRGGLSSDWLAWFDGVSAEPAGGATILWVALADQVALRGFLSRLWDLNIAVVSVNPVGIGIGAAPRRNDDE